VDISVKRQSSKNTVNVAFFYISIIVQNYNWTLIVTRNLRLVSDGANIIRAVSTVRCYQNICLRAICPYEHSSIKFWGNKIWWSCVPFSWLTQSPRSELRYPYIQLVHSIIFSIHVQNSTNKMSDCTEFPWKIFAHSSKCLCSNIIHKNFPVMSEGIRIFSLWPRIVKFIQMLIHSTASLSVQMLTIFELLYKHNNETESDVSSSAPVQTHLSHSVEHRG